MKVWGKFRNNIPIRFEDLDNLLMQKTCRSRVAAILNKHIISRTGRMKVLGEEDEEQEDHHEEGICRWLLIGRTCAKPSSLAALILLSLSQSEPLWATFVLIADMGLSLIHI